MIRLLVTLIICLVSVTNCKKDELFERYTDLVYREVFEIPAGIGIFDVHHFYIENVPSKYLDILNSANITPAEVQKVLTVEGSLSGLFGDADLEFIDKISIRLFADGNPSNYLEIAYRDPIPANQGNLIGLIPSLASSQEFISAETGTLNFDIVIWLRNTTAESIPMQMDLKLRAGY